jgi:penicillin amidase
VLVGDPRLPLRNPNSLWEAHVVGATFEVRGVTPAGSPNFLVGSTDSVAWSVTAMRLDQADLFELVLDPSDPSGRYMLDGLPTPWAVDEIENVLVAGGAPVPVRYRETVWGPVLTGFPGDASLVADVQPGEEFAVKWVGREPGVSAPARGWLAAYRAGGAAAFGQALGGVAYPGLNCVFADAAGSIGYWVVGALPLRSDPSPLGGQASVDGSAGASDWLDLVPHDLKPWVIDPADGFVYSANHLPVGGWYPLPFVSKGGHTVRSWRLRERLDDLLPTPASVVDPAAVVAVHEDAGWPLARDAVQLGLHLRDDQPLVAGQPFTLQADALSALAVLEPWADAGGDGAGVGDVRNDGLLVANRPQASALARWVGLVPFRPQTAGGAVDPALTAAHGQGESGFAFFLRERVEGIRATPRVDLDLVSARWVDHVLAEGWRLANTRLGPPSGWANWFQTVHLVSTVAGWVDLEGFPSLDPGVSADLGPVTVAFGETILSQFQQSYTQVVEPGAPDTTLSLLPGGQFENPASDLRQAVYDDQLSGWFQDPQGLKPAPLSRTAVEALAGPTVTTTLDEPTAP